MRHADYRINYGNRDEALCNICHSSVPLRRDRSLRSRFDCRFPDAESKGSHRKRHGQSIARPARDYTPCRRTDEGRHEEDGRSDRRHDGSQDGDRETDQEGLEDQERAQSRT